MTIPQDWTSLMAVARANLARSRFPEDTRPDWVEETLSAMRCSPNYPDLVAHNLLIARELCVAGCLFYELFTTSMQFAVSACETALKEKFVSTIPVPFVLDRNRGGGVKEERSWDRPFLAYEFSEMHAQGWRLPAPFRSTGPTLGSLIKWGAKNGLVAPEQFQWFGHRLRLRNTIAHGHNMVVMPGWALALLQETTTMLNQLFPDPETSSYDAAVLQERRARRIAWDRELEELEPRN